MRASSPDIFLSFFMFTADLRPGDEAYTSVLIEHMRACRAMGYDGFDLHIAPQRPGVDHAAEVRSYVKLKKRFDAAGLQDVKLSTNVGTTATFDPTSPYAEQRKQALAYLRSRVDITYELGGAAVMSGPFLYPYGAFPQTDLGQPLWSDALQEWLASRYRAAESTLDELTSYADRKGVKLGIEPIKSWETPGPTMVSEILDFVERLTTKTCGVAIDTAQLVMESQGPATFKSNLARAVAGRRLYSVHVSAPDRGAIEDCWIPWEVVMREIVPVFDGPYLVEVFNAIPPFDASMRMARRRFWRFGEDEPVAGVPSAYDVAERALQLLDARLAGYRNASEGAR